MSDDIKTGFLLIVSFSRMILWENYMDLNDNYIHVQQKNYPLGYSEDQVLPVEGDSGLRSGRTCESSVFC